MHGFTVCSLSDQSSYNSNFNVILVFSGSESFSFESKHRIEKVQ